MTDVATVKEFARKLKVSPKTIRRLIKLGEVRAAKVGRDWRIPWSELTRLLYRYHNGDEVTGYAVTSDGRTHPPPGAPDYEARSKDDAP